MRFLKTNTASRVCVGPFLDKTDAVTPETSLTVTGLTVELYRDMNDGTAVTRTAFSPTASGGSNDMIHVTSDVGGMYDLELTATQLNFLGRLILVVTKADTHLSVFHEYMVLPAMIYDAFVAGSDTLQSDMTQILGTALTETSGQIAAGFKQFFNVATPTGTVNVMPVTTAVTNSVNVAASQFFIKKNVALSNFTFPMYDVNGALKTGVTVTVNLSKDGGAFAASTNAVAEIGTTGWYKISLTATEMNATIIAFSATGSGAVTTGYTIITQA